MFGVLTGTDRRPLRGLCGMALAMSLLLVVGDALALGLGKLRVKSALDQPLAAEIELTSVDDAELETLKARLASKEDFIRANVDRPEFLGALQFEIAKDAAKPLIRITTDQAAREPFLHFLVTVEWAGGELIREYTALLDPPTYALDIPASVSSPRVVGEAKPEVPEVADQAATSPAPDADEPTAAGETTAMMTAPSTAGVRSGEYGPTQRGDTLWSIASKLDVGNAEINVFQIMIALLRENPDAFVNFNINRLRVGRILKLDNIETVAEITKQEASTVYTAHLDEWQAYRLQIAQASQTAMVPAATTEEPPSTDAADAVRTTTAEKEGMTQQAVAEEAKPDEIPVQAAEATQAGAMEKDVLRIVRPNIDKTEESAGQTAGNEAAAAEAQVLNDQIRLLEETLTSRELENKELRERVALLESQVEKTSRLIQLQSEQMAQMQQALAKPPTPAEPPAPAAAVATEERAMVQEVAKAEVKPPVKPVEQPEAKAAVAAPKVADKPKRPAAKPKPKTTTKVTAEPKKSDPWWQGILDSLFSSWQYLVGLGVAAVALLVGLLQVFRRRRSIAEFEESILTGSVLDGQTETTTDTTRATGATDTSFLSDFGMAGMGTVQADQVDPLAESEVYLAYGRDEQAEEVLKEAIKKDSSRYELKLKLLEIYQQRNDLKAFETLAEELYPAGDQGDPVIWQQVVAMGRTMNPHNPLFSQEIPAVAAAGADQQSAEDLALGTSSAEVSMNGSLQPFPEPDDGAKLEAELDALRDDDGVQRQPEQEVATGGDESAAPEPAARTEELSEAIMQTADSDVTEEKAVGELDDVDFDLDFEALEAEAQQQTESEVVQQLAEGLDFDVSPAPDNESVEEAEQRVANVMPLPGNTTAASAPTVEMTLDPSASETLSQPAQYSLSADLDELPTAGVVEAAATVPDAPDEEIKLNLEELAATVSDMDGVEPAGAEPEQWDEAATKLDLARAYIDMGDKDGARSIIDEVLKQGNPTQRTQAQELANQLSG